MQKFGFRLKQLRQSKRLTQADLAQQLEITPRTYQYYEVDKVVPPLETVLSLARFYDVSLDYLLALSETKTTFFDAASGSLELRLGPEMANELKEVAESELRTPENLALFLIKRGLESYKK